MKMLQCITPLEPMTGEIMSGRPVAIILFDISDSIELRMVMMMILGFNTIVARIHNLKVPHHPRFMVLKDVTMVHPHSWTIIGYPCDLNFAARWQVHGVFPASVCGSVSVNF